MTDLYDPQPSRLEGLLSEQRERARSLFAAKLRDITEARRVEETIGRRFWPDTSWSNDVDVLSLHGKRRELAEMFYHHDARYVEFMREYQGIPWGAESAPVGPTYYHPDKPHAFLWLPNSRGQWMPPYFQRSARQMETPSQTYERLMLNAGLIP